MKRELTALREDELIRRVGLLGSTSAVRRALAGTPEVTALVRGLRSGQIRQPELEVFFQAIAADFKKGTRSDDDVALAALAVALEYCRDAYAQDYLALISKLNASELILASRVASESLDFWLRNRK